MAVRVHDHGVQHEVHQQREIPEHRAGKRLDGDLLSGAQPEIGPAPDLGQVVEESHHAAAQKSEQHQAAGRAPIGRHIDDHGDQQEEHTAGGRGARLRLVAGRPFLPDELPDPGLAEPPDQGRIGEQRDRQRQQEEDQRGGHALSRSAATISSMCMECDPLTRT